MRDDETNATILSGEIRLKRGAHLQGRSNHELDRQQQRQVSLVATAVYSEVKRKPQRNRNRRTVIVIQAM